MDQPSFDYSNIEHEDDFDIKKEFFKYFHFWKYFLASTLFMLFLAFLYLWLSPKVFVSSAKIKVLDKKESTLEMPSASDLFSNSKINLENEIEVIRSQPILSRVTNALKLHTSVYGVDNFSKHTLNTYHYKIDLKVPVDSLDEFEYGLALSDKGFVITDFQNDKQKLTFSGTTTYNYDHVLPFELSDFNRDRFIENDFSSHRIQFKSVDEVVLSLKEIIKISSLGKESDIIQLSYNSNNSQQARLILNKIIDEFNVDGIRDRQLTHKRTIDFVNERYAYLSIELDSIEIAKQLYKVDNDLVDLPTNSVLSLEKSIKSEENIFSIENQISVTQLIINSLNSSELELLPANIGIENVEINSLITDYNETILERKKLVLSAGLNNPSIKQIDKVLKDSRLNIIFSLQNHLSQLEDLKTKLSSQFYKYDSQISNLPEKEKILRAIERNQQIKEALYLFLLQKREEAEVSFAVTEPSIKVVEYAITDKKPISPKSSIIILGALLLGILLPFAVLYIRFWLDTKIYSKEDFDNLRIDVPVLAEIPDIKKSVEYIQSHFERTHLAESFRSFASNLKFTLSKTNSSGQVIFLTSTIKGEGKTFTALNLALTFSSLNKKVLLIGADLRNPQLHRNLDVDKSVSGLSNYLIDSNIDWKKLLTSMKSEIKCDILLSGAIPPNPTQLLINGNLDKLLSEAKSMYDYIIVDTPPSLIVSDTISISHLSDLIVYVVRCNYTDKKALNFLKDLINDKKMNNVGLVLNALSSLNANGYSYNYGYGYGYEADSNS